jgi:hypothetical protein
METGISSKVMTVDANARPAGPYRSFWNIPHSALAGSPYNEYIRRHLTY